MVTCAAAITMWSVGYGHTRSDALERVEQEVPLHVEESHAQRLQVARNHQSL